MREPICDIVRQSDHHSSWWLVRYIWVDTEHHTLDCNRDVVRQLALKGWLTAVIHHVLRVVSQSMNARRDAIGPGMDCIRQHVDRFHRENAGDHLRRKAYPYNRGTGSEWL